MLTKRNNSSKICNKKNLTIDKLNTASTWCEKITNDLQLLQITLTNIEENKNKFSLSKEQIQTMIDKAMRETKIPNERSANPSGNPDDRDDSEHSDNNSQGNLDTDNDVAFRDHS